MRRRPAGAAARRGRAISVFPHLDVAAGHVRMALETRLAAFQKRVCTMKFQPGCRPGPGRPKGSLGGRSEALLLLDRILGEANTQEALEKGLREYICRRPVTAFRRLIIPLLPRHAHVDIESQRVVVWEGLMDRWRGTSAATPERQGPPFPANGVSFPSRDAED